MRYRGPLLARAQQPDRTRRIGVLVTHAETDAEGLHRIAALREGLEQFGWIEGRNIHFEIRGLPKSVKCMAALGARADVCSECYPTPILGKITSSYITAFHRADWVTE